MKKISVFEFNKWENSIKKKDCFLDIGCWSGKKILELNKKCNVFGMDIDEKKLSLADNSIKDKLKYADATKKIPFNRKFDWILLSEVAEHVDNDENLLKNISNSLKINGFLILTTPRSVKFFQIWDPAWVKWKFGGPKHYHYKFHELKTKLSKYGLEIEKYATGGSFLWIISRWLGVFLKYILRTNKQIDWRESDGFCDIKIIARKIK